MDISPESDGIEENPYYETITFLPAGDLTNAERQKLVIVRYDQVVQRKSNDEVFHDQIGYWIWDADAQTVSQTLTIPRGVAVVACGLATPRADGVELTVSASDAAGDGQIAQTPFMQENARTVSYRHAVSVGGDELRYRQSTVLDIYAKKSFDHTDENVLLRQQGA